MHASIDSEKSAAKEPEIPKEHTWHVYTHHIYEWVLLNLIQYWEGLFKQNFSKEENNKIKYVRNNVLPINQSHTYLYS